MRRNTQGLSAALFAWEPCSVPVHLRAAHATGRFSASQSILMQRHVPSRFVAIFRYADGLRPSEN